MLRCLPSKKLLSKSRILSAVSADISVGIVPLHKINRHDTINISLHTLSKGINQKLYVATMYAESMYTKPIFLV